MPVSPSVLALPGPFAHHLVHTHGTRLHVATAGDPRSSLIILLHDCLGGWFDYRAVLPLLAGHHHVASVSTRGFGQSDKPPAGYSIRHAVGDISGLIRALGHGKAIVVAAGSAARIAHTLAANYPQRVSEVVLLNPLSRSTPLHSHISIARAYASEKFSARIAQRSIAGLKLAPELADLAAVRELSYQIGGTHGPRIHHAKLSLAPLPINWKSEVAQPLRSDVRPLHLVAPAECASLILGR